ncbi:hypothetical protein ACTQ1L_06725 [Agathobacter sp. LCP21S3_B2]|uniref:hypothetical protein n=1 Tax=Agathobacter sp. LCP21S3_B2 TaxID=3438734 RepID=UPI003F8F670B
MNRLLKNGKIKYADLIAWFFALYAFLSLGPYFTWGTYKGGLFASFFSISYSTWFAILSILLGCLYLRNKPIKLNSIEKIIVLLLLLMPIANITISTNFETIISVGYVPYIVLIMVVLLPEKITKNTYTIFYTMVSLSFVIPIIIYGCQIVGISLPYTIIDSKEVMKKTIGVAYRVYPFAVNRIQAYQSDFWTFKLCGMFDEPGVVGTIAGLFLCVEDFNIKRRRNIIILIAGILSFSFAFYAICGLALLLKAVMNKRKGAYIIFGLVIGYLIFMNIPFSNPNIAYFQSRFRFVDGIISGDNRTNARYLEIVYQGFNDGTRELLFGHGPGSLSKVQAIAVVDGFSFYNLLYDYGFVGLFAELVTIILFAKNYTKRFINVWPIVICIIANLYQRPNMLAFHFMIIMLGGLEHHATFNSERKYE